ncbi:MAG: GNAT family N-acetyltransferase [Treponema sp.]|nr:GNAT family N-acetyltransferase [Treponema sp.]
MEGQDWTSEIPQGAFISKAPTYKVGEYFNLFCSDKACGMKYYFFDPTEHGFEKNKSYPLFIFLHGYTNALEGDVCINYAGAEFFATEKYQNSVGGAYILVPLANESRDNEGEVINSWGPEYQEPLYNLICEFIQAHTKTNGGVSKKMLWGNSAGAAMTYLMGAKYPEFFDILIPVGSDDLPEDSVIDSWDRNDVHLFLAMGKRDEFNDYQGKIVPRLSRLQKMKHCFIFTPDWVYNGDKGIASINFGVEMGQHCLVNPMHCNLLFDDGTPMDERLPRGLTDWLSYALTDHPYLETTPVLETERLILRPLVFDDLLAIYKWTGDEKTAHFMLYPQYKSAADGVDWVNSLYKNPDDLEYGFVWKETGELIGSGGVYHSHHPAGEPWSIGYNIRSDMWGKGITTEAIKKIIEYGRSSRGISEIAGTFAVENTGSQRVMEKLGMTFLEDTEYTKFDGSASFKAKTYIKKY